MKSRIGISSKIITISFFLLALLLAACGSSPSAAIPPGTYTATFTASDNIQVGDSLMTGTSSITFTESGEFTVIAPEATITGRYTVDGDRVKFDEGTGTFPCEDVPVSEYAWELNGNSLTFSTVEDSCYPRTLAMTIKPYMKEE